MQTDKYHTLLASVNEGFCIIEIIFDNKGRTIDWLYREVNPSFEKQVGIARLTGKYFSHAFPGEDHYCIDRFADVTKTGRAARFIYYSKSLNKWFEISAYRFGDPDEKLVALFLSDVTEQKLNEKKLLENRERYQDLIDERVSIEKDLKRTKKKLQTALRNASIGTWEWNLRTNEMCWDRRTEEIFGLKPGTFNGNPESILTYVHEEDVSYVDKTFRKALEESSSFEAIFRTKPVMGKCNYVLSKTSITRDRKGNPVNISGICFDVTDMKEGTERALISLNEDLLRSNRDLQQFAYVASHDLQEPLRMVSSFTQLLQQRYADKLDKDANDYINFAVNGSRRMYELLNGLLAYSRIQTKGKEFPNVNMNFVVEKVIANIKLLIEEADASVNCYELPVIKADENLMIQLMQNLIENAVKFTRTKPVVTISAITRSDSHIFSVEDNGIGIEPVYFEKIFRIFQRLHHEEYPGTGIGLAICQRIVERHGGRIGVSSKPGEGSVFSFSIPAKRF